MAKEQDQQNRVTVQDLLLARRYLRDLRNTGSLSSDVQSAVDERGREFVEWAARTLDRVDKLKTPRNPEVESESDPSPKQAGREVILRRIAGTGPDPITLFRHSESGADDPPAPPGFTAAYIELSAHEFAERLVTILKTKRELMNTGQQQRKDDSGQCTPTSDNKE